MLKKVDSSRLRVGMYVHALDSAWMAHPFLRSRFLLSDDDDIRKIVSSGILSVTIDCSKGLDADDAPTIEEAAARIEAEVAAIAAPPVAPLRSTLAEEFDRAVAIRRQAAGMVRAVMQDARLGRALELDQISPVVESITGSILRNASALLGLSVIKNKDDYTFMHSVSVCTLMVAFGRSRKMDAETIYQAGIGGLLHDTGKALIPDHILNKPGRLTEEEFAIVRRHPKDGHDLLLRTPGIGAIPLDITLHHHERRDGSGYPDRYQETQISELAQMAAIVDVYDAITADRCYHKGIPAAEALRKMYEWSQTQFDPVLVQEFMRCVGIYPVGTLVLLESGRLGVVIEPHETSLLTPKVNVFYSTRSQTYIKPQTIDLARGLGFGGADRIVRHEAPEKWQVDPQRFMALA